MTTTQLRRAIPALANTVYLNCGWAGPCPVPVLEMIQQTLEMEASHGPATPETTLVQRTHLEAARKGLARLLGTNAECIALTGNATTGICIVAAGLDWRPGDEVIISDQEHCSNALPWYQLQLHSGVTVKQVPVRTDTDTMLAEYERAISGRTRLISVSHVVWTTGQALPVRALAQLIHARGGWLVVDGAQSTGQVPADVALLGADCYSVPGQKWLLGPSGTGGAYFSPALAEAVVPRYVGWSSVESSSDACEVDLCQGARRFETATVSAALYAGLARALALIQSVGVGHIQGRIQQLVGHLRSRLERTPGVRLLSPAEEGLRTGIFTVHLPGAPADAVVRWLFDERRMVARAIASIDAVRLSIHAYNTEEEMDRVADALAMAPRG